MSKRLYFLGLIFAALASFLFGARAQTAPQPPAATSEPVIRLKALDGKIFDLAERRGEVVVASFGATWCVPCVWELKAIEELVEEYANRPVRFVWISIESKDRTPDSVLKNFAKTYRLTIPVLRDEDGSAMQQFSDNRRIPLVVFIDTEGRWAAPAQRGMSSDPIKYKEKVRARVDALLGAAEPKTADGMK